MIPRPLKLNLIHLAVLAITTSLISIGCGKNVTPLREHEEIPHQWQKPVPLYRQGLRPLPKGIDCSNYPEASITGARAEGNLEDVSRLQELARLDLERKLASNVFISGFPSTLTDDYYTAQGLALTLPLPGILLTVRNPSGHPQFFRLPYKVNVYQVSLGDPYNYLFTQEISTFPEVSEQEWEAIKDDLCEVNSDSEDQCQVLRSNLRWADPHLNVGASDPSSTSRRSELRKRGKRIYCRAFTRTQQAASAFPGGIYPETEMPVLYGIAKQLEGDFRGHCVDGLDQQITRSEQTIIGESSGNLINLGMAFSKIFMDYKKAFVEQQAVFSGGTEDSTYIPQVVQRRMQWILGLNGPLTALQYSFARFDGDLSISALTRRFYLGQTPLQPALRFEAFSPLKMIHLLNLAVRRAYIRGSPGAIDPNDPDGGGVKLTFSFLYEQIQNNQSQGGIFVEIFRSIENFVNEGTVSEFVEYEGSNMKFKQRFWTTLLIHYGYLVSAY